RHQIVDVVVGARLDGATEHIDEQQHERDRHDRDGDDGVHAACDMSQRPPEHDAGVGEDRAHRCASNWCSADLPLPTIARKISSSVGCRSTYYVFAGGSSVRNSSKVPDTMIVP